MLGDISYDKATLQSEGKKGIHYIFIHSLSYQFCMYNCAVLVCAQTGFFYFIYLLPCVFPLLKGP